MEGTFVLIAFIVWNYHVGISSGSSSGDLSPNLIDETQPQDDNQPGEDDISLEDFLQTMINETQVEDDIQQQRSNMSTRGAAAWSKIIHTGLVISIAIKDNDLYGVGTDNQIYKHSLSGSGGWSKIIHTGRVTAIAIKDYDLYGVGMDKQIWKHSLSGSGSWSKIIHTGSVIGIAIRNNDLYGVGTDKKVWKHFLSGSNDWSKIIHSGLVMDIAIQGSYLYGIGMGNKIWRHSLSGSGGWSNIIPGSVISIAIKGSYLYGVGMDKQIWKHSLSGSGRWSKIIHTGQVIGISIKDNDLYGIGTDKQIWKHSLSGYGSWSKVIHTGQVIGISIKGNYLYGIGTDKKIWKHSLSGYGGWSKIINTGSVIGIAITDNYLYGVGTDKKVWKHSLSGSGGWSNIIPGSVIDIAIKNNDLYGVGMDKKIWKHSLSGSGSWSKLVYTGDVISIAIKDNDVYGVGMDKKVWKHPLSGSRVHGGWSSWGRCSKTCRYGYQYRSCTNPRPQYGGRGCSGSASQRCNENVCCPVNGGWSGWGRCSHSCKDYGKQTRTCTNPRPACGGRGCSGSSSQKCNQHICCPVNGGWSGWSRCNKSCKDGALQTRTCTNPRPSCNGRGCSGSTSQKCNQHVFCPVDGGWSSWSKCSKTCKDGAVQTRTCTNPARKYGGKTCSGSTSQKCNQNIPCSSEIRKCISTEGCPLVRNKMLTTFPELSKEFYMSFEFRATQYIGSWQSVIHLTTGANAGHGGRVPALWVYNSGQLHPCFSVNGNTNYQIVTSTKYSVGQWHHIEFSQALENSKYIYRVKIDGAKAIEVVNSRPSVYSTVKIYAADPWNNSLKGFLRNLIINTHKSGGCGGKDSGCCTSTFPCGKDDGDCDSNNDCLPGLVCGTNNCPNKGVTNSDVNTWDRTDDCCTYPAVPGGWSSWGKCSKTCKTGAVQTRTCTNPKPQHGGKDCLGSASQKCNQNIHCPIPGGWSTWSKCSKTCKDGALQTRTCTEPKPQHGGKHCSGPASQKCNQNIPCPIDGGWSSWSNCGKTCKDGAVQTRACTEPKSQHGGKNCPGSTSQKCNQNIHCPIDGGWNIWSKCSETCNKDGAVQIRKCDNPKPEHGGTHCSGLVSQKCNQNINCGTTSAPATCPPIPTCPPIATCLDKTCPPIPSCPTVPPTPTCPPKTTCPTKTCPPTPTCPTAPQQTPCPAKTCPSIPTCPTETCPPIPTCPTEKCPPSPICPTDGAVTTTTSKTSDTCDDTGCKNAFNGLGMCVDTASADWVKLSKTIDFTAGTKDGKCSKSCNCNCYKHTGCYSDQCDAKQGICLIPEQVENRGFFIPNEYKKAFPCNKSLNCYCYIKDYVGVTKSAEVVTEPRSKPSCKPTKKCTKKKGKCFGKGETIPEKAKRRGWCNKKMGCKCYKV